MEKILDGKNIWHRFDASLASYAQKNATSRGRKYQEPADPERLPFQRDRDRIIHTAAFRRLRGKTQVVTPDFGDHYRNRLSHTLEVSLVSRDLARQLYLNEDLAEAISLAHDLGHPPFGHSGENALDKKMREHGQSFDHNQQSLRIVDIFERRYPNFPGLNLTYEVREGMQKHEREFKRPEGFVFWPHLEGQLVDISDEIAYLSADIEDGLRGDFFSLSDLKNVQLCARIFATLPKDLKHYRSAFIRKIIGNLLKQIVLDTQKNLEKHQIKTLSDVQNSKHQLVVFNPEFYTEFIELKHFLFDRYYANPKVRNVMQSGEQKISDIFDYLVKNPEFLPKDFIPEADTLQRICDYIAGMTDNFVESFLMLTKNKASVL